MFLLQKTTPMYSQTRQAAVAGSFYPEDSIQLKNIVLEYLNNAKPRQSDAKAVVSPHAGYVYSGQIAADAINQINPDKEYKNVFVIGISHHQAFEGASVYLSGDYEIPGAIIKVNKKIASELVGEKYFFNYENLHRQEHSIEVQLPFLYYHLKHKFNIVPILIGTQDITILKNIAEVLRPYFEDDKNVFVFSSDFSHYPEYEQAVENDRRTAEALISNNPQTFIDTIIANSQKNIPNLFTSACGMGDLLVLLYLTEKLQNADYQIISYKNSGDVAMKDKSRVVGYYAISVILKKDEFSLTKAEKEKLLEIARSTIESYIRKGEIPKINEEELSDNLKMHLGAFVTLTENDKLRGCIGRFMPKQPLWSVVQDMAIAAATQDSRFLPVTADELDKIHIEISVLTPLQKISSLDELQIGRDGIYIKMGIYSGTLLPQVATENGWDKLQFVEYCSQYKAGIGKDGWKKADLFIYQAIVFEEE